MKPGLYSRDNSTTILFVYKPGCGYYVQGAENYNIGEHSSDWITDFTIPVTPTDKLVKILERIYNDTGDTYLIPFIQPAKTTIVNEGTIINIYDTLVFDMKDVRSLKPTANGVVIHFIKGTEERFRLNKGTLKQLINLFFTAKSTTSKLQ